MPLTPEFDEKKVEDLLRAAKSAIQAGKIEEVTQKMREAEDYRNQCLKKVSRDPTKIGDVLWKYAEIYRRIMAKPKA